MDSAKQIEVSRVVHAPAARVFALLADPRRHVDIDGSGLLRGSDADPITGVGQTFAMYMHRGDLGDYRVINTVREYVPYACLGWAPDLDRSWSCSLVDMLAGVTTGGHTYTYRLREVSDGTEVTQTYDWADVKDPTVASFCPFISSDEMSETLARIASTVEESS
ncbi:hypothetical protein [Actinomycetospora flava]|uniref:Polyketide cyclase n=1 Tax=Actinomycetospora flava TaxID=3129232 RepID=A0ABU8MED5_9PSEU